MTMHSRNSAADLFCPQPKDVGQPECRESTGLPDRKRNNSLIAFFGLTFAITWGIALLLVLFPDSIGRLFGPMSTANPLFILAVAGPTLAATLLTWLQGGGSALKRLYMRLLDWRFGARWYALMLVGLPLIGYGVSWWLGTASQHDFSTPARLFWLLLNQLILGPLGEELGWRGFALPRLLQRFTPLIASLILGTLWGIWHLPSFFLSGLPQTNLAIPVFLLGALGLAILATWIFLHTNGSVLSVALFHYMVNLVLDLFGVPLPALTLVLAISVVLVLRYDQRIGWIDRGSPLQQPPAARLF